jgi:hypothetical protein
VYTKLEVQLGETLWGGRVPWACSPPPHKRRPKCCEFGPTGSAEGGDEDGLDGVEPILGLVEDDAGG